MANLIYPSEMTRTVIGVGSVGTPITSVASQTATIYTDAGGTTPASIFSYPDDVAISLSHVTLDSNGKLPFFFGPDTTTTTLYVKVGTGPVTPIYARCIGTDDPSQKQYHSSQLSPTPSAASLPSQTGQSGKYLTTDGSNPSWATVAAGGGTGIPTVINVTDAAYGAKCDAKIIQDAAIGTGTATLTSATAAFVSGDVGKLIAVGGAAGTNLSLVTTISSVTNSTTVVLAANASATVSAATAVYGTNDATAIATAKAALPASGGTLYVPGRSMTNAVLNFDQSSAVTIRGAGGRVGPNDLGGGKLTNGTRVYATSALIYTGSGATAFISCTDQLGLSVRDIGIHYVNSSFTGDLVTPEGSNPTTPAMFFTTSDSIYGGINGMGLRSAGQCLNFDKTVFATIRECTFGWAQYGVACIMSNSFSNAINIFGGEFYQLKTSSIRNPGNSLNCYGVTFEPLIGMLTGALFSEDVGKAANAVTLHGCGFWDATGADTNPAGGSGWIWYWGDNLRIRDCYMSIPASGTGINAIAGTSHTTMDGFIVEGTSFDGPSSAVDINVVNATDGSAYTIKNAVLAGNTYRNGISAQFPKTLSGNNNFQLAAVPGRQPQPRLRTGQWYGLSGGSKNNANLAGLAFAFPIYLPAGTVDGLGILVQTGATGTATLGLYADNKGQPGARLAVTSGLDISASGWKSQLSLATVIDGGVYWLGLVMTGTGTVYNHNGGVMGGPGVAFVPGGAIPATTSELAFYSSTAALNDPFPALAGVSGNAPDVRAYMI